MFVLSYSTVRGIVVVEANELPGILEDDVEFGVTAVGREFPQTPIQWNTSLEYESIFKHLFAGDNELMIEEKQMHLECKKGEDASV